MPTSIDHGERTRAGILAKQTPEFRRERAVKAAAARESLDRYVQRVVDAGPTLTAEHLELLGTLRHLLPAPAGPDGGAAA